MRLIIRIPAFDAASVLPSFFLPYSNNRSGSLFDEDKTACEAVQEGVRYTSQPGVLSLEEERVHKFQQDYLNYLK